MDTSTGLQPHPAAELFPLLAGAEYDSFKADIATHGLLEPIWLYDGKILDGRNRYRACAELGIEPRFRPYEGESPVAFAWSANGARRNLTKSQKAAIAVEMLPQIEAEAAERKRKTQITNGSVPGHSETTPTDRAQSVSVAVAGKQVGVGESMVQRAKKVKTADPALFEKIKAGQVTVEDAVRNVRHSTPIPEKPTRQPREKRVEQIRELASEGNRASQIASAIGLGEERVRDLARRNDIVLPDAAIRSTKINPRRILETTVDGFEGTVIALNTIWGADWGVSPTEAKEWCDSMDKSFKALNRLRRELREIANGN